MKACESLREAFGCIISIFKCNVSHRAVGGNEFFSSQGKPAVPDIFPYSISSD